MEWIGTAVAALWWMLLGAAIGTCAFAAWHVRRGKRLWERRDPVSFGLLLGAEADVLKGDGWHRCRIVAVSHKGAVAVRNVTDRSGRHAKWIPHDKVPERVRFRGVLK